MSKFLETEKEFFERAEKESRRGCLGFVFEWWNDHQKVLADVQEQGAQQRYGVLRSLRRKRALGRLLDGAVEHGAYFFLARLLNKKEVSVEAYSMGWSHLKYAVLKDRLDMVRLLCTYGADVNANRSTVAGTPLHVAASRSDSKAVEYLLSVGADHCVKNESGNTPLECLRRGIYPFDYCTMHLLEDAEEKRKMNAELRCL